MYRLTTPTLNLDFGQEDVSTFNACKVSIVQGDTEIIRDDAVISTHSVTLTLTQEETKKLSAGTALIQCNFTVGGVRKCSDIVAVEVSENLYGEIL